jgi:spore coat protein CotH
MIMKWACCTVLFGLLASTVWGGDKDVVINEVMYHPPGGYESGQYVELYNRGRTTVNLSGWKFTKGIKFTFPQNTEIKAGGFAIIAKDRSAFGEQHGRNIPVLGIFDGKIGHGGEKIELINAAGEVVESFKFSDSPPWPTGPDGYGPALERINPFGMVDDVHNWASSKIPQFEKPSGTPGRQNDVHSTNQLPVIGVVKFTPIGPDIEMPVRVEVQDGAGIKNVMLLYRSVSTGNPGVEKSVAMKRVTGDGKKGEYEGVIERQKRGALVRFRIKAVSNNDQERLAPAENEIRPTYTWFAYAETNKNRVPEGFVVRTGGKEAGGNRFGGPAASLSARGGAAFIYLASNSAVPEVFDHVRISQRKGGFKVRFHKDHTLRGMSVVNIISEGPLRWLLSEPLAYELYRMAGVPAEQTEHIRVNLDGRQLGYQLLIEQPNKAFLVRNRRDPNGDLFKLIWYGNGVVGKHEKKTNLSTGHERLIKVIDGLNKSSGDQQWEFIQQNFNVDEFVNYYAVNMCIQNWDGFFNNYYAYHDLGGSGKWEIYPWDEDKTWGDYDGASRDYDWYEMPLTYGSKGDRSPRELRWLIMQGPFGGTSWWRPPGYFSGPLLANSQFREKVLKRVRELCMTSFTEERFYPVIKSMERRLELEPEYRAKVTGENPEHAVKRFRNDIESFYRQVKNRRKFLLEELDKLPK